jgi:hypothetical protein
MMEELLVKLEQAQQDILDGRYDEALAVHVEFNALQSSDPALAFIKHFALKDWGQLARVHAPARISLQKIREREAALLRQGDLHTTAVGPGGAKAERFHDIAAMDDALNQPEATHALFLQLEAARADLAQRYFRRAFAAILAVGDYALASRYAPDPRRELAAHAARLNDIWANLWPAPSSQVEARVMAETIGFAGEAAQLLQLMRGLGQDAADGIALDLLTSEEAKKWVAQELADSGTISAAMAELEMKQDQDAADTQ